MFKSQGRFTTLNIPDFRFYLCARFFLTIAYQMQTIILGLHVYELSKQPLALGLSGLAEAVPAIGMALIAGNIVDRSHTNKLILIAVSGLTLSAVLSFLYIRSSHIYYPTIGLWPLYAAIAIGGFARAFIGPCNFSIVTRVVPKHQFLLSGPIDSGLWQIAAVAGPALGGILYAYIGASNTMLCVLFFFLTAIFFVTRITTQILGNSSRKLFDKQEFFKGVKFIYNHPMILSAFTLDMFAVLFGGAVALLPVVATEILHVGPEGLGFLRAAPAIGSALMGVTLTLMPPIKYGGRLMIYCVFGFGLATIGLGLSRIFILSWFLLFLTGVFDCISVIVRSTITQIFTPEELRGRTSSVRSMFIISSNEIGAFESGLTAQYMGTSVAIIFGGSMSIAIAIFAIFKAKDLLKLNFSELGQE